MSIGKNQGIKYPATKGNFNITLSSTESLRKFLLAKNLEGPYLNRGSAVPPNGGNPGSQVISQFIVQPVPTIPYPEDVTGIDGIPFDETLFLTNKFGPMGGYGDPLCIESIIISEGPS